MCEGQRFLARTLLLLTWTASLTAKEQSLSTSVIGMVKLLEIEAEFVDRAESYADELQVKVDALKSLVHELKNERHRDTNKEEYLFNPLKGFALVRRLHHDWPEIESFMSQPVGQEHLSVFNKYRLELPTGTDLAEASSALYRLQTVYDLKVEDLGRGMISGQQYDGKLKSIDCYFMGYYLYVEKLYYPAGMWLHFTINEYEQENYYNKIVGYGREQPLKLYAETLLLQNRAADALSFLNQALEVQPLDGLLWSRRNQMEFLANTYKGTPLKWQEPVASNYERGCRGEFAHGKSKLFCLYNTTTTSFLQLAPLKMEIINWDPYMVLFHDVLSNPDIEHLKTSVQPRLKRAEVYDYESQAAVVDEARTSQFSYFENNENAIIERINRRIVDMTGFDLTDSELLQVGNYGMAGHYGIHFDFFNVSHDAEIVAKGGDRLATVLFYLSDVEMGGATVFPELKIAVPPRKGSALVWYNLNNRLEANGQTLHAACPVLVGSKWVGTKWIRTHAQIFRKPCYKE